MPLISFLLFQLLFMFVNSNPPQSYQPTATISLVPDLQKLTYSHNQRILVGFKNGAEGEFFVFNGLKLNNKKTITLTDERKQRVSPSAFAFSKNDNLLIVGSKQGGIYVFNIANNTINTPYNHSFVFGSSTQQNWIKVITFSTSNKIAISFKMSLIILEIQQQAGNFTPIITHNFTHSIYALTWSILQPSIIIVGTIGQTQGEFLLYNIQNNNTTLINKDKTQSLAIFPNGNTILKGTVGKDIEVYTYRTGLTPIPSTTTIKDSNDAKEICVASNGFYLGVVSNAGQVKAWVVGQNAHVKNLKNQNIEVLYEFLPSLNQPGKALAFAQSGGDIIIIPNNDSVEVIKFSLCENKKYFNQQTISCETCSQNCNYCFDTQTCITCNPNKFISGDQCIPCESKLDGCITCSSQDTCLTCNQNEWWNPEAKNGKCQCQNTYYNNEGKCQTCSSFLDCLECAGTNNCTSCKDQGNFNPKPKDGLCLCKDTFWLNTTQCTECSSAIDDCQSCTQDGQKCTQCQSTDRKPNAQQTKCICVDFKYQDQSTKKCEFCDLYQNCITCQPQQPHKCLKCNPQKHFQQEPNDDGQCVCAASYFIEEGKCNLCSEALVDCQLCDTKQRCLLCKDENNFNTTPVEGGCVCIEKWILVNKTCELCSDQINGCLTCSSQAVCTICDENAHFNKDPDAGNCKCMAQYWLNDKVCQQCSLNINGCKTCTENGQKCLTCEDQSREPSANGESCNCKPFTYQNASDNTCQPCDTKHACTNCSPDNNHECTKCDQDNHWNSQPKKGECKCMDGYNEYDNKCIFCLVPGCTVCPSQSICEQCSQDKKFQSIPIHNQCKCKNGTRQSDNKTQCIDCNVTILGCISCSNAHNCELCDSQHHFVINPTTDDCHCDKGWYLKSNVCQNCTQAIGNCLYCSADANGNNIECNKCKDGWGTASKKKSCIPCRNISPGCISCDQSTKCTSCDTHNGFIINETTCTCTAEHYLNGEYCALCASAIPGCKSCLDQSTCMNCTADDMFDPVPNINHKCDCVTGWILDEGKCTSCGVIAGCVACSDLQTCMKCDELAHFERTQNNKCQCQTGYWIDKSLCKPCDEKITNCLQCSQDGNICSKCSDPDRILNNEKDKCICQQFMFENTSKVCEFCDTNKNCKQCTERDNCTICDTNKKWTQSAVNGQCICQPGYQQWSNQCLLCQVNGCAQCHQENKCFQCSTINKFIQDPVNGTCQCQQHTFIDGSQCYQCSDKMVGCSQCESLNECTLCNENNYFVLNQITKKCQCDSKHYFESPNCIACSRVMDYCSQCIVGDEQKECIKCQTGFVVDTQDKARCLNCQQLMVGCFDCTDAQTCKQCNADANFQPYETECICKHGFFLQDIHCVSCHDPIPGCMDCDNQGKKCTRCDQVNNFIANDSTQKCDCVKGFYLDDHSCEKCSSKLPDCAECLSDGLKCLVCDEGFYLIEGQCQKCLTKTPGCTKCSLDGEQCSQCNTPHFILNKDTLKCNCEPSYFIAVSQCALCSTVLVSCKQCSIDGKNCLQCQGNNFILNPDTNRCQCDSGYYLHDNATCELCAGMIAGCSKCNQQGSVCFKCNDKGNFVLNKTSCSCIDGYFLNKSQNNCNICSAVNPGCTKCSQDGQQSLECNMTDFILNQTTKRCQCRQGYYTASNTQCRLCEESIEYCSTCQSSSSNNVHDFTTTCSQCQDTFTLNDNKTQCVCEGNNKEITNGVCRDKQSSSNWLLYGGIAGGLVILVIAGVCVYLRRKKSKLYKLDRYDELEEENNDNTKPQTILTSDSVGKTIFNSSQDHQYK